MATLSKLEKEALARISKSPLKVNLDASSQSFSDSRSSQGRAAGSESEVRGTGESIETPKESESNK